MACVANGSCTLTISTDGNETSLGTNGLPIFQLNQTTPSQKDVIFTSDYAQVVAGSKKVTLIATAGGITLKRLIGGIQVAETPVAPAGSGFANLADRTVDDITTDIAINAGGVTDPRGRAIVYSIVGLPPQADTPGTAYSFNTSTGLLSGGVDIFGTHTYSVTVTATPTGSTKSISKTFQLTINDVI